MSKVNLGNVTLVSMTSVDIENTIEALKYSCKDVNFGCVKLITHENPKNLPSFIKYEYIDKMNRDEWSYNSLFRLHEYIDTDFMVLIQPDGFVVNGHSWKDEFYEYDYIGAPWGFKNLFERGTNNTKDWLIDREGKIIRVGNGISLRSKKLLEIPSKYNMPWVARDGNYNEDTQICIWNRDLFLDHGIKFAEYDVAKYFSQEEHFDDYQGIKPFCFHNFGGKNEIYKNLW